MNSSPFTRILAWEIQECVSEEMSGDTDLDLFLTLTGSSSCAYAATCSRYIQDNRGDVGMSVLAEVKHTLATGSFISEGLTIQKLENGSTTILIHRKDVDQVASIVQTLAWLAATFRRTVMDSLSCSSLSVLPLPNGIAISLLDLTEAEVTASTSCWHALFRSSVIAEGFPTRTGEVGLELPFSMILDFTKVIYRTDLSKSACTRQNLQKDQSTQSGIFYTGVHSVLFAVSSDESREVIRWHYQTSDKVAVPDKGWLRLQENELREDKLLSMTIVLGYTPQVKVLLGTEYRKKQYGLMDQTSAERERGEWALSMDGITFSLGYSGSGIQFPLKYKKRTPQKVAVRPDLGFDDMVKEVRDNPVILFETHDKMETGWLVSKLSVILDLVHYHVYKENLWDDSERSRIHAKALSDGGIAAQHVLDDYERANLETRTLAADRSSIAVKDIVV